MVGKTHYLSDKVIDQVLKNTDMGTFPTQFMALFTVTPTDAYTAAVPTGTEIDHAALRTAITFGANSNGPSVGRESANTGAVDWTTWDGTSPSTIAHCAKMEASTGGEMDYFGPVDTSRIVNTGEDLSFAIGDLVINED